MWKNVVERGRPQMTIWRLRVSCWITKATDTHLEYVAHPFSTATDVKRKPLNVTLHVHCVSCCVTLALDFESFWLKCAVSFRLQAFINREFARVICAFFFYFGR